MHFTERKDIVNKLKEHGYKHTEDAMGIKVHINQTQYIDISRGGEGDLYLDIYTNGKINPNSLEILEDHGRIRFDSLIKVLDIVKKNLKKN
ncbi:hypothetical protein Klosneuvirus_4_89 [Klosneuvirus KNV1]|uniref:Uncharacterized protein n=1 Tax=Klosneuvirus KNV1 TaxID=1977640 RepID=A0A1V0SKX1_9VIRU|nr:hypothetical protein Klosneuvirus_4_89 [Klosneuvirus KNV1]